MAEPTTIIGLVFGLGTLIISNIAMWIREWKKHQSWKKNNGSIGSIKTTVENNQGQLKCLDQKMGKAREDISEVKTAVKSQVSHCKETVGRMDNAIAENRDQLFQLAKNTGK